MARFVRSGTALACVLGMVVCCFGQCEPHWRAGTGWPGVFHYGYGGYVNCLLAAEEGGQPVLHVGGSFAIAGNAFANCVAKRDGPRWAPLGEGFGDEVFALTIYNGELIAGGAFTLSGSTSVNHIARWDGQAWQALGTGLGNYSWNRVTALAVYDGRLVAGGSLSGHGNLSNIAQWDGNAWQALGGGCSGQVFALANHDGVLLAGGQFSNPGTNLAAWNGTSWSAFGATNGRVSSLLVDGSDVIIGGRFTYPAVRIARLHDGYWQSLGSGMSGGSNPEVNALAVYNGELHAGGSFQTAGGGPATNLARWDGAQWNAVGGGTNNKVLVAASFGERLVVGGWFSSAGEIDAAGISVWNGTDWCPVANGPNFGPVDAVAVYNGEYVAAGRFDRAGCAPAQHVARWNGSTWRPMGSGFDYGSPPQLLPVYCFAEFQGDLIAGGRFIGAGGQPANRIARWNGTDWEPLGTGVDGPSAPFVDALVVYNGELIVGGYFTTGGGVPAANLARWNGTDWQPFGGGANSAVSALQVHDGELFAGGAFTTIGGVPANRVARWDGTQWHALGSGCSSFVEALASYDGQLYAGGGFQWAGGLWVNYVARWNGTSWASLSGGVDSTVTALAVHRGELFVGGIFSLAGGVNCGPLVRWNGSDWLYMGNGIGDLSAGGKWVAALAADGQNLVVGGLFDTAGDQVSRYWASWVTATLNLNEQPASQTTCVGNPVVFHVSATGDEPITFQWRRNGVDLTDGGNIAGATTNSLSVVPQSDVDAGVYDAVVTNTCDPLVSEPAVLGYVSPTITQQPTDTLGCLGAAASLHVVAGGAGVLGYQWYHDGVALSDDGHFTGTTTDTLLITATETGDAGDYTVVVTDTCGAVRTQPATLTPRDWPVITQQPESQAVAADNGATAYFTVVASGPPPTYQWCKDGVALVDDDRIWGTTTAVLTINYVTCADAGAYHVVVSNGCPVTSASATLTPSPCITLHPVAHSACWGGATTFHVEAVVTGVSSFQWRADHAPLFDGGSIHGATTDTLLIDPVGWQHGLIYDVVVSDQLATAFSNPAELVIVNEGVSIHEQPVSELRAVGEEVFFVVGAAGMEPIQYQWRRDGVPLTDGERIQGTTTFALHIFPVLVTDAGAYSVEVANGCETVFSEPATLTVLAVADLNCDGGVDFDDINPFVLLLTDPVFWQAQYPNCCYLNGDCDGSGTVDFDDINPFIGYLSGG